MIQNFHSRRALCRIIVEYVSEQMQYHISFFIIKLGGTNAASIDSEGSSSSIDPSTIELKISPSGCKYLWDRGHLERNCNGKGPNSPIMSSKWASSIWSWRSGDWGRGCVFKCSCRWQIRIASSRNSRYQCFGQTELSTLLPGHVTNPACLDTAIYRQMCMLSNG